MRVRVRHGVVHRANRLTEVASLAGRANTKHLVRRNGWDRLRTEPQPITHGGCSYGTSH